ncbi:MAG: CYTH domain-containing protein, partial [Chloroflexi bacterium]|nr:CYTH domain-containing protein [Chloroflexota bacterium]
AGELLAQPFLETETDRRIVDLEIPERGWQVELALDRMRVIGHAYAEIEIEAELKAGDEAALAAARAAIEALGTVHESKGSKLSRAAEHVAHCDCRVAGPEADTLSTVDELGRPLHPQGGTLWGNSSTLECGG